MELLSILIPIENLHFPAVYLQSGVICSEGRLTFFMYLWMNYGIIRQGLSIAELQFDHIHV